MNKPKLRYIHSILAGTRKPRAKLAEYTYNGGNILSTRDKTACIIGFMLLQNNLEENYSSMDRFVETKAQLCKIYDLTSAQFSHLFVGPHYRERDYDNVELALASLTAVIDGEV